MTALQASIGSLNDLVDAPRDVGRTPAKPIPGGLVSRPLAWLVVATAAVVGVALSLPSGPLTTALALVVLGIGYAYDLWFKGTAWSWVPFAVGIPLLPAYGWLGTTGDLPAAFAILLPAAVAGRRRRLPSPTRWPTSSGTPPPGLTPSRRGSGPAAPGRSRRSSWLSWSGPPG